MPAPDAGVVLVDVESPQDLNIFALEESKESGNLKEEEQSSLNTPYDKEISQ